MPKFMVNRTETTVTAYTFEVDASDANMAKVIAIGGSVEYVQNHAAVTLKRKEGIEYSAHVTLVE